MINREIIYVNFDLPFFFNKITKRIIKHYLHYYIKKEIKWEFKKINKNYLQKHETTAIYFLKFYFLLRKISL